MEQSDRWFAILIGVSGVLARYFKDQTEGWTWRGLAAGTVLVLFVSQIVFEICSAFNLNMHVMVSAVGLLCFWGYAGLDWMIALGKKVTEKKLLGKEMTDEDKEDKDAK